MSPVASFRTEDQDLFEAVRDGRKRIEVRAATPRFSNVQAGETLTLQCGDQKTLKRIVTVQKFSSVEELIRSYGISELMPGFDLSDFQNRFTAFPGYAEKIQKHGLVAFTLEESA